MSGLLLEARGQSLKEARADDSPVGQRNRSSNRVAIPVILILLVVGYKQAGIDDLGTTGVIVLVISSALILGLTFAVFKNNYLSISKDEMKVRAGVRTRTFRPSEVKTLITAVVLDKSSYSYKQEEQLTLLVGADGVTLAVVSHQRFGNAVAQRVIEYFVENYGAIHRDNPMPVSPKVIREQYPNSIIWIRANAVKAAVILTVIVFAVMLGVIWFVAYVWPDIEARYDAWQFNRALERDIENMRGQ